MYDAAGTAGPDVVLWRGSSRDDNITVITTSEFKNSVANYERRSEAMKRIWLGLLPAVAAALWSFFAMKK